MWEIACALPAQLPEFVSACFLCGAAEGSRGLAFRKQGFSEVRRDGTTQQLQRSTLGIGCTGEGFLNPQPHSG